MFNFFSHLLRNRLVQAMLFTAAFIGSYNVVMADEKPATLGELANRIVEEQRGIQNEMSNISSMMIAHDNYVECRRQHGFGETHCQQEWETFEKTLDQE